jgi:hypothetical protein
VSFRLWWKGSGLAAAPLAEVATSLSFRPGTHAASRFGDRVPSLARP